LASINDFTNPFSGISEEIYNEVLKCTKGNEKLAQEFSKKAMAALKKVSMVPPVLAVNSMPQISMAMLTQPQLQVNTAGILTYLQKQAIAIKSSTKSLT